MELYLTRQESDSSQVTVVCDQQPSHTFDIHTLPSIEGLSHPPDNPVVYGTVLYAALFPPGSLALQTLEEQPERILLVTTDDALDALPWEYVHGPDGFLVSQYPFVRGLPAGKRLSPPLLDDGLQIVAVPSNPISDRIDLLDIESEWTRLTSIMKEIHYAITLERTRPPTVERLRELVAGQQQRVVHFMGHGGQTEKGAILCFEKENGDVQLVTASELVQRLRGSVFLVTLNACKSATPGVTHFSNLAAALVRMKIPYALGMRFSIHDDDALTFSKVFYGDLARGTSVEEALLQARLSLANSPHAWAIGVPALYSSLNEPASGFRFKAGKPEIIEHQPRTDLFALPSVQGAFQGRLTELVTLGTELTGERRPRLITLHGAGGQGKTALARIAAERFAFAYPDGVWAITLEHVPTRETFVAELARFLGVEIAAQHTFDQPSIERQVLTALEQRQMLMVLDNVETLVEAVEADDPVALQLGDFIKQLPEHKVGLLITSRRPLEWPGERLLKVGGLSPHDGATLFRENAPQRAGECDREQTELLSHKLLGHPLGLLLLGKAFNGSTIALSAFIKDYETQLLSAEDKFQGVDHRQRTLYASIETSLRYLNNDLRDLFRKLWIFHAPFLAATAVAIFDPEHKESADEHSPVEDQLYALWKRGLLASAMTGEEQQVPRFYRLLPTMRPFVEHYLAQAEEREALLTRFGSTYEQLVRSLNSQLDHGGIVPFMITLLREDIEQAVLYVADLKRGYYLLNLGWILQYFGELRGLELTELAFEIAQGKDKRLELLAKYNLTIMYRDMGRAQEALRLGEKTLSDMRAVGDRKGEASILNIKAGIYRNVGRAQEALQIFEESLFIMKEIGDRAGEAVIFNDMASVYRDIGKVQTSLELYEKSLSLKREKGSLLGITATLNNIAGLYQSIGRFQEALDLYKEVLPIAKEVGDRAGEATALNNIALVYWKLSEGQGILQVQEVLQIYEEALSIKRGLRDRVGEAATLNNMALLYRDFGKQHEAFLLNQEALFIIRETGNYAGESAILNCQARIYQSLQLYSEAVSAFEQSIGLAQQISNPSCEAAGLVGLAKLLYQFFNRPEEAIMKLERGLHLLKENSLPQSVAGDSPDDIKRTLSVMRARMPLDS